MQRAQLRQDQWNAYERCLRLPPNGCFWLGADFGEGGKPEYFEKNPQVRLRSTETQPKYDCGGRRRNVEYNAKLTSQGILHRDTRIVAHLDIHSVQEDLTSVFKWELVFSLGQAVWMAGIP